MKYREIPWQMLPWGYPRGEAEGLLIFLFRSSWSSRALFFFFSGLWWTRAVDEQREQVAIYIYIYIIYVVGMFLISGCLIARCSFRLHFEISDLRMLAFLLLGCTAVNAKIKSEFNFKDMVIIISFVFEF